MRDARHEKVMAAFPSREFTNEFFTSFVNLKDFDYQSGAHRLAHAAGRAQFRSNNLASGRNQAITVFLESDADWLWFIDTDQSFEPNILERMLASADPIERPILSALIVAIRDETRGPEPACAGFDDSTPPRLVTATRVPPVQHWPCIPGTGCVLIHRSVLAAVGEARKDTAFPWCEFGAWDRYGPDGEVIHDVMGEDYTFMIRANALGFTSWVDTTIHAGHVKNRDIWPAHVWPDIVPDETFVVIPVKDKLDLTKSILRQLFEQGSDKSHVFVYDNGSDARTKKWLRQQRFAEVFQADGCGIHEMWNRGAVEALARSRKANVAFLNNDLAIGPNMLATLAGALRSQDVDLMAVCPNYDGRPRLNTANLGTPNPIQQLHGICANRYDGEGGLAGFCFMVRGELFQAGYRFPEDAMWWYGDNDLTLTLDQNGMAYAMVHDTTVEHLDGGGQTGDGWVDYAETEQGQKDLAAFLARWPGVTVRGAA